MHCSRNKGGEGRLIHSYCTYLWQPQLFDENPPREGSTGTVHTVEGKRKSGTLGEFAQGVEVEARLEDFHVLFERVDDRYGRRGC